MITNKGLETGLSASLLSSLQPLLTGILPTHRGKHLLPDLGSGLSHTYLHWYCQIYDKHPRQFQESSSGTKPKWPVCGVVSPWEWEKKTELCRTTAVSNEPCFPGQLRVGSSAKIRRASGFAANIQELLNSEGTFLDCLESHEEKFVSRNERHCKSGYRMDSLVLAV